MYCVAQHLAFSYNMLCIRTLYHEGTDAMPKNPTLASAKRAFTTSFGPICFGSLLIAIIQLVRAILRELANQHEILAAIVDCIMGYVPCSASYCNRGRLTSHFYSSRHATLFNRCIQALFEYFSSFAFVYVAIYGQGFIPAAKSTYRLISGAGINVIIADLLIGPVLGIGMLLVGLLSGGIAFLMGYLKFGLSGPELNAIILVTIIGFIVGIVLMSIVTSVIDSGVQTILVCVAEDPASLQRTKPELYNKFRAVYPQIQWS